MTPGQERKQDWLRGLADLRPDLVVNTGDNLAHRDSVPVVRDSLGPLLDVPGVFVFGSNDYYSPSLRNPLRYLLPDDGQRNIHTPAAALAGPRPGLHRRGLARPDQPREQLKVGGTTLRLRRRRRPAPGVRRPRRGRRPGRPGRRPAPRRHARAVPAGARPVRRRRLRRDDRRPHPRRPGVPARTRGAHHQLRPRARPGQGPAPAPGGLAPRRSGLGLAARLGRPGHLSVRPGSGSLPPRGHPVTLTPEG